MALQQSTYANADRNLVSRHTHDIYQYPSSVSVGKIVVSPDIHTIEIGGISIPVAEIVRAIHSSKPMEINASHMQVELMTLRSRITKLEDLFDFDTK